MLSSRVNPNNGDNDGESTMPGDYEVWSRAPSRIPPSSPSQPAVPPTSQPRSRSPIVPPNPLSARRPPPRPNTSPDRQRRRRSITPDIVVDRRRRHHHSSGRDRVIRISLDNRPTLGLRGGPKRILELERVRCRRRKKYRPSYHENDNNISSQPQQNIIIASPMANPCLPPAQSSFMPWNDNSGASLGFISNLTPEMIENLPKQTVRLPPIHLPGSQADANTELHTVIFPAELINPIDGTLSVIQSSSASTGHQPLNIVSPIATPTQPQVISASPNDATLQTYLSIASGPFLQQLQDLLQRITLVQLQSQSAVSSRNQATNQPSVPVMAQSNPQANSRRNPINTEPYPSANIRPPDTSNNGFFNPSTSTPFTPGNIRPYRPANITPYRPANSTPYRPADMASFEPAPITPVRPTNATPYRMPNATSTFQPTRHVPPSASDIGPYRPANITSISSTPNRSIGNATLPSSVSPGTAPYVASSPLGSNGSFSTGLGDDSVNTSYSPQSQTLQRPTNPAPKSILRNGTSAAQMNTTYTRLNPSSVASAHSIVRKTTKFA